MKTMLLGVVAALAMLCGRAEAVTLSAGDYWYSGDLLGTQTFWFEVMAGPGFTKAWSYSNPSNDQFISAGASITTDFGSSSSHIEMSNSPLFHGGGQSVGTMTLDNFHRHFIVSVGCYLSGEPSCLSQTYAYIGMPDLFVSTVPVLSNPIPGALPMFLSALGLGGWLWRRRTKRLAPAYA